MVWFGWVGRWKKNLDQPSPSVFDFNPTKAIENAHVRTVSLKVG